MTTGTPFDPDTMTLDEESLAEVERRARERVEQAALFIEHDGLSPVTIALTDAKAFWEAKGALIEHCSRCSDRTRDRLPDWKMDDAVWCEHRLTLETALRLACRKVMEER